MGLTIAVGLLARASKEDRDDFTDLRRPFDLLNEVLAEAGMAPHHEPLDLSEDQIFEAQMWGYGGLHAIRRLAAYHTCENRLPPPDSYDNYAQDRMIEQLNQEHARNYNNRRSGLLRRWLVNRRATPRFQHLLWHSDCEGFYIPRDFEYVVMDNAVPQREGIGGMVGSSTRLLKECVELATLIALPNNIDPEADELWDNAENPPAEGTPWQVYGVEAFGLARLIRACELSIETRAALIFG